ncbi:2-oxoglutarate dehydrogenase E1 subunit family protein [Escherichia coli]
MQNSALKASLDSSYLSGANQSWIEQLYEDFLTDPDSVADANWRSTFQQLPGTGVRDRNRFHSQTRYNISAAWQRRLAFTLNNLRPRHQ